MTTERYFYEPNKYIMNANDIIKKDFMFNNSAILDDTESGPAFIKMVAERIIWKNNVIQNRMVERNKDLIYNITVEFIDMIIDDVEDYIFKRTKIYEKIDDPLMMKIRILDDIELIIWQKYHMIKNKEMLISYKNHICKISKDIIYHTLIDKLRINHQTS